MPPINDVWANTAPKGTTEELTLPSGQTCTARRLGLEGLIEAGILTDIDTLTGAVDKHVRKVRGANGRPDGTEVDERSLLADQSAMRAIITVADRAIPVMVVDPPVALHYSVDDSGRQQMIPPAKRITGQVYTDQIGFEDKMFLFEWGVEDLGNLNNFRQQPGTHVAGVANGGGVSHKTKRAPRAK